MAHAAAAGEGDDQDIPAVAIAPAPEKAGRAGGAGKSGRTGTAGWEGGPKGKHHDKRPRLVKHEQERRPGRVEDDGPMARLFLGAGRKAGIRPGDLVGAITGEAGLTSRSVGAIEIADNFSLVDVPESLADNIIAALKATTIRGKKVPIRRDRGQG
jgi:ATP-dependent RNA helicase DeaD